VVALLDAASRPKDPTRNAIYPFTRLGALGGGIQARLAAIAREALGQTSSVRRFAVRALGRSGPEAVGTLSGVVIGETFSPSERADAARELAKHGPRGQEQLRKALAHLTRPDSLTRERLLSAHFGPLITVLQALEPPAGSARDDLSRLAELALPVADAAALRRRIVALRCRAAALLAGSSSLSARLVSCDPVKDGRIGALAMLEVLDRGALVGARFRRWSSLVDSPDPVVRQSALRLMSAHPEIEAPHRILGRALTSKNPGTVAAAAEVLAAYPDRAAADAKTRQAKAAPPSSIEGARTLKPDTAVMSALATGYKTLPEDAIEARVALLDAASALQLLSLKPALETACKSENGTLREHAERGLRLLGDKTRRCNEFFPADSAPAEVEMHLPTRVRLEFDTDVGPLHLELDPELAPVSVARIVRLAERGFYDGLVVHRVVPGFVAQFGDPDGDGYGGTHEGLLRSEGSPAQFGTWSVGLALSGRDTGSSQLFVTLGPFPHLDGDYPLLGQANDSWEKLAQGDVIRKVRVSR
jgi:cyclophilin family peptidyl-prolyl cis-trans isomerase